MPSPPATDDGAVSRVAEGVNGGFGDSEHLAEEGDADADAARAAAAPGVAEAGAGARFTEAGAGAGSSEAGAGAGSPEAEAGPLSAETDAGAGPLSAETDAGPPGIRPDPVPDADGSGAGPGMPQPQVPGTAGSQAPVYGLVPLGAEPGRWFRPGEPAADPEDADADRAEPEDADADRADPEDVGAERADPKETDAAEAEGAGGKRADAAEAKAAAEGADAKSTPPEVTQPAAVKEAETPGDGQGVRWRIPRRALLQAGMIGGAGVAALPLLALVGGRSRTNELRPGGLIYSMNTNWRFGGRYTAGSESAAFDDTTFAPVVLPHTVTELSWQNWDPAAWQQVWIYRRHFNGARLLGSHGPGSRILVDFDGVMVNTSVVLNDQAVATHRGGYLPFSVELTGKVTAGDNLLAVIVDSRCLPVPPFGVGRGPGSVDFLQPGGIYRDVRLRALPQAFLSDLFASPAEVLSPQRRVDVECTIDSAVASATGTLLVELLDGPVQVAAEMATVTVGSPGVSTARLSLTGLGPVRLWSPDSPALYTVRATLTFPGLGRHVLSRRIGFREASFRPEGFFLNGKRLQLFGLDRHQLYPYAGMAMPARVQRKDAEILKREFNCNMVRCSHYPQSPHFLDACDELGLLVWEEAPGWHAVSTDPAWQDLVVQNVRDMVRRDRSRPSVIIWGTRLNETLDFPALWAATRRAAAELDGTRPSSGAMASHQDAGWAEDVFAFNDYGVNAKTGDIALKPPFADLPYLVTEAVGVAAARPGHFAWTDPPAQLARQAALHGQAQSQARSDPRYSGLLAWVGFDYASMLSQRPDAIKWAGVADGFRVPKPGAAIYQSQADPAVRPVIIPVFFWERGGAFPNPSMIASNCERLEVFVGGRHAVTARPASGSPLYSGLAHPPFLVSLPRRLPVPAPELLIQGFAGGRQVAEIRMSADPAGDTLAMTADDQAIWADGSDATRAVFRAIDAFGNQRRFAGGQVELSLSGPAALVGDNPFAFGQYGGLGAVWIRSLPGQEGSVMLTASHPLLGQAKVYVRSVRTGQASPLA